MGLISRVSGRTYRKFNLFNKPPTNINIPIMQAEIDTFINSNKIAIISKSYCPFCTTAKKAFQGIGAEYQVLEIEDYMGKITGARSVPRVFINGRFEGGGDDIAA